MGIHEALTSIITTDVRDQYADYLSGESDVYDAESWADHIDNVIYWEHREKFTSEYVSNILELRPNHVRLIRRYTAMWFRYANVVPEYSAYVNAVGESPKTFGEWAD